MNDDGGVIARALAALHKAEDAALALLLGAMIILAPLQIFLRNFFDSTITWGDPMLRVLVLWVGLLGAVTAARGNRHISIDVLSRFLPPRPKAALGVITGSFTTVVCALVAYHSFRFVFEEYEYDSVAFSGMKAWICQAVIPFSFGAIGLRSALYSLLDGLVAVGLREPSSDDEELQGGEA